MSQEKAIYDLKMAMYRAVETGKSCEDAKQMLEYHSDCLVPIINGLCFHLGIVMKMTNDGWDQPRFSTLGNLIKELVTSHIEETDKQMYMQHCQFCERQEDCQNNTNTGWGKCPNS